LIPARKRWGQHFLIRPETAQRIVDAARIGPGDTAFEVGPGEGALTRPLAARAGRVLAVEIDPLRVAALERDLAGAGNVRVLPGDVLERSFAAWLAEAGWAPPAVLVSNLPYNAATPILLRAVEEEGTFSRVIATVQREVARRFAARPGEEGYGDLSVRAAAFARARSLFDLPAGAFRPPPRVTSSVVELVPRVPALEPASRDRAVRLASLAFRSRRKTAANSIAAGGGVARSSVERALADVGFDPRARAGEISLEGYLALADRLELGAHASPSE
jgi:16S rRNA (adenine1518-N6/adenine1519-N6)-dimethyltransferase